MLPLWNNGYSTKPPLSTSKPPFPLQVQDKIKFYKFIWQAHFFHKITQPEHFTWLHYRAQDSRTIEMCSIHTFFKANDAVCPARSSFTGILFRCIVLTVIGWNCPKGSGPSSRTSFSRMVPRRHVPDTTVPTPYNKKDRKKILLRKI